MTDAPVRIWVCRAESISKPGWHVSELLPVANFGDGPDGGVSRTEYVRADVAAQGIADLQDLLEDARQGAAKLVAGSIRDGMAGRKGSELRKTIAAYRESSIHPNDFDAVSRQLADLQAKYDGALEDARVWKEVADGNSDIVTRQHCQLTEKEAMLAAMVNVADGDEKEINQLKDELARMREALRPFAELAEKHHGCYPDDAWAMPLATVGHLRKAKAALTGDGGAGR